MSKVRYIDWTPADWLTGTRGMLTQRETGVYDLLLNLIYDRDGRAPNDAKFLAGHFKPEGETAQAAAALTMHTRRAVDQLVALGKLRLSPDGEWLTNGRADETLAKHRGRITSATAAGIASGESRRAKSQQGTQPGPSRVPKGVPSPDPAGSTSAEINDLGRTTVNESSVLSPQSSKEEKKEPETLSSESVRARARKARSETINGGQHVEARQRLPEGWLPTEDQCGYARSLGLEPQHVADAFVLWWVEGKGRNERRTERGWNLTWQGWCRRDAERGANRSGAASPRAAKGGGDLDAFARGLARVVDAERNRK